MCDECTYTEALDLANEMLDDPRYEFADRSIEGIRDWIQKEQTRHRPTAISVGEHSQFCCGQGRSLV